MTPPYKLIRDYIAHWASVDPAREAAVSQGYRLTYAELLRRQDEVAKALIHSGVEAGDRVAVLQAPGIDFLVTYIAATSIGAIWLGLNPKHQLNELSYVIGDAEPRIVLARQSVAGRNLTEELGQLKRAHPRVRFVSFAESGMEWLESWEPFCAAGCSVTDEQLRRRREAVDPRAACLLVYTSGSTGTPKGALLHQQAILNFSVQQNALWPLSPLRALNFFPINHIGCVVDLATPALVAGGLQVFMEEFDPDLSLDLIANEKLTLWASVPATFQMQLQRLNVSPRDLSSVRLIVWEGAPMARDILPYLAAICPTMATNYGMTETTSAITATAPMADLDYLSSHVGPAFPGVEVRLADDQGITVESAGQVGEVQVRSPNLFLGYWRNDEATRNAFTADGFFRTGDLAERTADGSYLIVGRIKDMYKSGGYNVYPREVEAVLESHPGVAIAAVVPVPDRLWQEVGLAFVMPQAAVTPEELKAWCADRLANYKRPKRFVVLEQLPFLPVGKVDKVALRVLAKALHDADQDRP